MPKGKRKHVDPPVKWTLHMPESLALRLELFLMDPATGEIAYGARSRLVQQLLRDWLEEKQKALDTSSTTGDNAPNDTEAEHD